jgi:hypothetical protein
LDAAQSSEAGILLRQVIDIRAALKLGVAISLEDIRADEFRALSVLEEERDRHEREQMNLNG